MQEKDTTTKIKTGLIRRQHIIFVAMIAVGISLITLSQLVDQRLLSEGIAFIIVGFVGILMSWTTMDIGASIKEAIHDVGIENRKALIKLSESTERIARSQDNIAKLLGDLQDNIAKSQDNIAKSQDNIAKSQDNIAKSQDNIVESLGQVNNKLDHKD